MKTMTIAGQTVPALGIGTWHVGEGNATQSQQEQAALRAGLDAGLTLIDTAEMYGEGRAETLIGQVLPDYARENLFLVSKFYPWHATAKLMRQSLLASLQRLHTDYLDLYLLHWPGTTPIAETMAGLAALQKEGLIRAYGVSNFDVADLEAVRAFAKDANLAANEVLYNPTARGIEYDLLPYQRRHQLPMLGYSPFGSGDGHQIKLPASVQALAEAKHLSAHQLLLAWAGRGDVLPLVKTSNPAHMAANLDALAATLTPADETIIDAAFPAPTAKVALQSL